MATIKNKKISQQGGTKGMHKGHEYIDTCKCARCMKVTAKKHNEIAVPEIISKPTEITEIEIDKIVADRLESLPKEFVLIEFDENTIAEIKKHLIPLMKKYNTKVYNEFMSLIANDGIKQFLKTIDNG